MANFPNMEQIGAEIDSRLTTLETNNANYLTKTTADAAYLGINAKAASASKADSATKATQDGSGNVITDTYLTKNSAATTYLGINAKAASASTADNATSATNATNATNATKATQDGDGNVISTTYLKKTEKAASATIADSATKATQDANGATIHTTYGTKTEVGQRILATGARGSLAGYETSGTSTTINASSPDANEVGSAITVSNGSVGTSWTKIVRVTAEVTVTLGDAWAWQGGSAPTITAGGVLVCCWCGSGGIAQFVSAGIPSSSLYTTFRLKHNSNLSNPSVKDRTFNYTYTDPSTKQTVTETVNLADSEHTFPCAVGDTVTFSSIQYYSYMVCFTNGVDVSPTEHPGGVDEFSVIVSGESPYIEYYFKNIEGGSN